MLVRGKERARVLTQTEKGLHVELHEDFDQTDLLENLASNYDSERLCHKSCGRPAADFSRSVVIQCTHGTHAASAAALIRGLGKRKESTGAQTYYIHVSEDLGQMRRPADLNSFPELRT